MRLVWGFLVRGSAVGHRSGGHRDIHSHLPIREWRGEVPKKFLFLAKIRPNWLPSSGPMGCKLARSLVSLRPLMKIGVFGRECLLIFLAGNSLRGWCEQR